MTAAPKGWSPGQTETRFVEAKTLVPRSYDARARTVQATFATGYRVRRWFGWEELAIRDDAINLQRVTLGKVRLLDHHNQFERNAVLGVVTDARVESGALVGTIQFADSDAGREAERQVSSGELTGISVGYRINKLVLAETGEDDDDVYRADSWELLEVSLVSVPADPFAGIRSASSATPSARDNPMPDTVLATDTTRTERQRAAEITKIGQRAGLDAETVERAIEDGTTIEAFRTLAFDKLAGDADRVKTSSANSRIEFGRDAGETVVQGIEGALYARMSGKAPEGPATEFMGRSLLDLGATLLQARGERVSWMSRERLATQIMSRSGYHTTSDFPVLLTQAGSRVLQDAYAAAQSPLKALARRRTAADFRTLTTVRLSEAPQLLKVGESGEVKHGSRSEEKEAFKVETFARIFSLSRNAIINDDLGAFADSATAWGRAAAETEATILAGLLTGDGAVMDDNKPLYHADHGNKATAGAALSVESLGKARQALREMKGLDGRTPIGVTPRHLVVGPTLETEAEKVLAQIAAAQVAEVNPFSGRLILHIEPRFTGNSWRLFADPAEAATISIAYLNGQEGPILEVRDGWETLGAEFRAVLDFGAGITDFRGTYLSPEFDPEA